MQITLQTMKFLFSLFLFVSHSNFLFQCCTLGVYGTTFGSDFQNLKRKVIIDTDAGVDDGVAILNLLGAEKLFQNVEVKLITTVNGNTNVNNVGKNVLKVLKTAQRLDIPVYRGANYSLLVTPPTENYFGKDGFGDFPFPDPPSENLIKKQVAASALIAAARSQYKELTLICLAPLTNVALAIKLDPKFLGNLKEIYILGGSDSGQGNINPGVEFNFYMDPEAAFIVFREAETRNITLNLLTWETAFQRSVIEMDWRRNVLGAVDSPQVNLINKAEKLNSAEKKWISSDMTLSSVAIDESIIRYSRSYHVDVEICGRYGKGAIFVDYENSTKLPQNVKIISEVDTNKLKYLLLRTLNS